MRVIEFFGRKVRRDAAKNAENEENDYSRKKQRAYKMLCALCVL